MIEKPRPRKIAGYMPTTWQPWYISISDWMIRNPSGDYKDYAKDLGRNILTIRYIIHSDIFQEFHSQRKAKWREAHDFAIVSRMTQVATKSLDLMIDKMEKQADKIPMNLINEIATSSLDRLGYAPAPTPQASVNVNIDNRSQTMQVPVTAAALSEAREALRAAEQRRGLVEREIEVQPPSAPLGPPDPASAGSEIEEIEQ